jgi:tRNA 2-thiouridine synthesizing protein A
MSSPADEARVFDGGDMGCGELVMALAREMRALPPGGRLEVSSRDPGAPHDLPAWARMTGHAIERTEQVGTTWRFVLRKGG